jgi:hypothetical protein
MMMGCGWLGICLDGFMKISYNLSKNIFRLPFQK